MSSLIFCDCEDCENERNGNCIRSVVLIKSGACVNQPQIEKAPADVPVEQEHE